MQELLKDQFLDIVLWRNLGSAFICGFVIGLERQLRGKTVGVRTASLICIGSMSFVHIGMIFTQGDPVTMSRIFAQLITGIGFIGAGVIMNKDGLVNGVTSASVIWILAALGAAIGLGFIGQAFAITLTTVFLLAGFEHVENIFNKVNHTIEDTVKKKFKK